MYQSCVTVACASMQSIYLIVHLLIFLSYLNFFFSVHEICISLNCSKFIIFVRICILYRRNDNVEFFNDVPSYSMIRLRQSDKFNELE